MGADRRSAGRDNMGGRVAGGGRAGGGARVHGPPRRAGMVQAQASPGCVQVQAAAVAPRSG
eukprot:7082171-Prymnesium_polylepis.1